MTIDSFVKSKSTIPECNDPYIKMTMADKLDPLLIGAYNKTIDEAKQYLMEVPRVKNSNNKEEIIETFTKKYEDHGFPITQKILRDLKFEFSLDFNDDEIENMIYDIHDTVLEFIEENNVEALISTPNGGYVALYGSEYEEEREENS